MGKYKSRNIPPLEYFEVLQEEYICAAIRYKIYPRISDKKYYQRVMEKKKDNIIDLGSRNFLTTIFDDSKLMREAYSKLLNEFGPPNFLYNPLLMKKYEENRDNLFPYKGSLVRIKSRPDLVFIVDYVDFEEQRVYVKEKDDQESEDFPNDVIEPLSPMETDLLFFYYPKTEVRIQQDNDVLIGKVVKNYYIKKEVDVEVNGQVNRYSYNQVGRIL